MNIAEAVDRCKGFVKSIVKDMNDIESSIKPLLKTSSTDENTLDNVRFKLAKTISEILMAYVKSIIQHIKALSRFIHLMYKVAKQTTNLGVKNWVESVRRGDPGFDGLDMGEEGRFIFVDINSIRVIEIGEYAYIDLGRKNFDALYKMMGFSPGFCILKLFNPDLFSLNGDDLEQEVRTVRLGAKMDDDTSTQSQFGLVFIDVDGLTDTDSKVYNMCKTVFNVSKNSKKNLEFVIYHEIGHVVTGQTESFLGKVIDADEKAVPPVAGFVHYAKDLMESRADAYACLKCGITPEQIVEARYNMGMEQLQQGIEKGYEVDVEYNKNLLNEYRPIMLKNVKDSVKIMRSIVKLSPYQYLRSKFLK